MDQFTSTNAKPWSVQGFFYFCQQILRAVMTLEEFKITLAGANPPAGINDFLRARWYEGKGDWAYAHEIAQVANTSDHCLIHAYLHRKEGDAGNAGYWYNCANQRMPGTTLEEEWEQLVRKYLTKPFSF